jgi:hypothetical protein
VINVSSNQTSISDILQYNGILLGILGILTSFVFAGIVFVLGFDTINSPAQIALFTLFLTFLFLIGSMFTFFDWLVEAFLKARGLLEAKVPLRIKIANTFVILGTFFWLISIVLLFFSRDLVYLGFISSILVIVFILIWYLGLWRPKMKHVSLI